jgi:hypothetical protein
MKRYRGRSQQQLAWSEFINKRHGYERKVETLKFQNVLVLNKTQYRRVQNYFKTCI